MADIPSAKVFTDTMDPHEVLDFTFELDGLLEEDEEVDSGNWTFSIPIEGSGLGLIIMTGGGRDPVLQNGNTELLFWLDFDPPDSDNVAFDGAGTEIPLRVHFETNSSPSRERERTAKVKVAQL